MTLKIHQGAWGCVCIALAAIFVACSLCASTQASPQYVSARDVAKSLGLTYKDVSDGKIHACKLTTKDHEALFSAGVRSIRIDGESVTLEAPIRWDGQQLELPSDAKRVLMSRFKIKPPQGPKNATTKPGKQKYKVVIDPGHGGDDPGAVGRAGLREKDVALDVSQRLAKSLRKSGVKVVMTRRTDVFVELDERVAVSNREAPDLFVSIHVNSVPSSRPAGALTLYPDDGPKDGRADISGRAKKAARERSFNPKTVGAGGSVRGNALLALANAAFESNRLLSIEAANQIQKSLKPVTGCWSGNEGVIEDYERGLRVLRGAQSPAVLVEMDFLSNRTRERKLRRTAYRAAIAKALHEAVLTFLKKSKRGTP